MKLTISTGAFPALRLQASFRMAAAVEADGLELMLTPRLVHKNPDTIRALEAVHGVPVKSVHSVMRLRGNTPEQAAEDTVRSALFASRLPNCEVLVVHTPNTPNGHGQAVRHWIQAIERACEISGQTKVTIENGGVLGEADQGLMANQPRQLLRLAEEWDLGITYDTSHAASRDWDLPESLDYLLPRIRNVHLSDYGSRNFPVRMANALLRDHRLPGSGILPISRLLRQLSAAGYDGLVTLELSPFAVHSWWLPTSRARLTACINTCRRQARTERRSPGKRRSGHAPAE